MNLVSLKSKLAVAAPLALVCLLGASHVVVAQPDAPAAKGKRGGRKAKGGLPPKTLAKIEAALGKPLTEEQKTQLGVASQDRRTALAAAQSKFDDDVARITGLPLATVQDMKKDAKKEAKAKDAAPKP